MAAVMRDVGLAPRSAGESRRTTLGVALVAVALLVALLTPLRARAPSSSPTKGRAAPTAVTLAPGDTLWEVAARYAPPAIDPRAYVDELIALNRLQGAPLAGQRIRLPG